MRTSQLTLPASHCEQFRKAFVSQTRASLRLCRAGTDASFAPWRYPAIKSIDVEFAHFVNKGQITTAAAEVCLVAENGSVLLNSYICPGTCVRFRSIKASEVSSCSCCPQGVSFCRCRCSAIWRRLDRWSHSSTVHKCTSPHGHPAAAHNPTRRCYMHLCMIARDYNSVRQLFEPYLLFYRQFADRIRSKQRSQLIASAPSQSNAEGSDQIQKVPVQHWSGSQVAGNQPKVPEP